MKDMETNAGIGLTHSVKLGPLLVHEIHILEAYILPTFMLFNLLTN